MEIISIYEISKDIVFTYLDNFEKILKVTGSLLSKLVKLDIYSSDKEVNDNPFHVVKKDIEDTDGIRNKVQGIYFTIIGNFHFLFVAEIKTAKNNNGEAVLLLINPIFIINIKANYVLLALHKVIDVIEVLDRKKVFDNFADKKQTNFFDVVVFKVNDINFVNIYSKHTIKNICYKKDF